MPDYDLSIDDEVTLRLISEGHWEPGTLLLVDSHIFMVIGYSFWGWLKDCDDSSVFYDIILYHVTTGIMSCFPLKKILETAVEFAME